MSQAKHTSLLGRLNLDHKTKIFSWSISNFLNPCVPFCWIVKVWDFPSPYSSWGATVSSLYSYPSRRSYYASLSEVRVGKAFLCFPIRMTTFDYASSTPSSIPLAPQLQSCLKKYRSLSPPNPPLKILVSCCSRMYFPNWHKTASPILLTTQQRNSFSLRGEAWIPSKGIWVLRSYGRKGALCGFWSDVLKQSGSHLVLLGLPSLEPGRQTARKPRPWGETTCMCPSQRFQLRF